MNPFIQSALHVGLAAVTKVPLHSIEAIVAALPKAVADAQALNVPGFVKLENVCRDLMPLIPAEYQALGAEVITILTAIEVIAQKLHPAPAAAAPAAPEAPAATEAPAPQQAA